MRSAKSVDANARKSSAMVSQVRAARADRLLATASHHRCGMAAQRFEQRSGPLDESLTGHAPGSTQLVRGRAGQTRAASVIASSRARPRAVYRATAVHCKRAAQVQAEQRSSSHRYYVERSTSEKEDRAGLTHELAVVLETGQRHVLAGKYAAARDEVMSPCRAPRLLCCVDAATRARRSAGACPPAGSASPSPGRARAHFAARAHFSTAPAPLVSVTKCTGIASDRRFVGYVQRRRQELAWCALPALSTTLLRAGATDRSAARHIRVGSELTRPAPLLPRERHASSQDLVLAPATASFLCSYGPALPRHAL